MGRGSSRARAGLAAACAASALAATVPFAGGAGFSGPQSPAERRAVRAEPDAAQHSALLELYALETELHSARSDLAALEAERSRVAERRAAAQRGVVIARRSAAASKRRLEELVRVLYERGSVSALEILLSSRSLDEALTGLDGLDQLASEHRRILVRARSTRDRLAAVAAELEARADELARLTAAAHERARDLETGAAAKARHVAALRRRQTLTPRQTGALESAARAAQRTSEELAPAAPDPERNEDAAAAIAVGPDGTRTLTVTAIAYSLPGTTSTGLPVGHGIAAVDPTVIPLGTRMSVPGYGDAVAADTGPAVRGAMVDLWFATAAEAEAWGSRTVVITLR